MVRAVYALCCSRTLNQKGDKMERSTDRHSREATSAESTYDCTIPLDGSSMHISASGLCI